MITLFRVWLGYFTPDLITIKATRQTKDSYWDERGRMYRKDTEYEKVFDSFAEAKAYMVGKIEKQLTDTKEDVKRLESKLAEVQRLQHP